MLLLSCTNLVHEVVAEGSAKSKSIHGPLRKLCTVMRTRAMGGVEGNPKTSLDTALSVAIGVAAGPRLLPRCGVRTCFLA